MTVNSFVPTIKYSNYVLGFQPVVVKYHKFIPWGYDKSIDDPELYLPNRDALRLLEYVMKRIWAGASYASAARELKRISGRKITRDGMCKHYRKWCQYKGLIPYNAKRKLVPGKVLDEQRRLANNTGTAGNETTNSG